MLAPRKHIWILITVVILLVATYCASTMLFVAPSKEAADLTKYISEHESELINLIEKYPGQYRRVNNHTGIKAIDTRDDDSCFIFSWSFDLPEGGSFVYFADDGVLEILGFSFTEDTHVEGLGLGGQGYIKCVMLKQNWFFIEYNIPT